MAIDKTKTTLNIDKELLRFIKLKAIDLDITQTELITLYLKQGLINKQPISKTILEKRYSRYKKLHQK